jgi:predicted TIM-barrel fold metal-dependent hydrolase
VNLEDMIFVSVDDHICEPPDMFRGHVPKKYEHLAPHIRDHDGVQEWWYGEKRGRNLGTQAAAGKPREMLNFMPHRFEEMRAGCYDVHERVRDMSAGGYLGGLNFPNFVGFAGQVLSEGPDLKVNEIMIKAYNDWHIDEWCAAAPDRFIPCAIVPLFDADKAAAELRRVAAKGCHAVTFSENPSNLGRPSLHSDYWDPVLQAACDEETVLCLHVGSSSQVPSVSAGAPPSVGMSVVTAQSIFSMLDLIWASFWERFPDVKFSLTEGDIGWIPYFLQRSNWVNERHSGWTGSQFPEGTDPSDVFQKHIISCFIHDPIGVELINHFNVDNVCWECDYPHSDSLWPVAPERAHELLRPLNDGQINRITHENAMRHLHFDPYVIRPREKCTVGALRSEATDVDVVTRVGRPADERDLEAYRDRSKYGKAAQERRATNQA